MLIPDSVVPSRLLALGLWLPLVLAGLPKPNSATVPSRIWQSKPGARYNESFLLGNGRLGAAVSGAAKTETIPVNEDSFWSGPALSRVNPDAREYMGEMQGLVREGRPGEATTLGSYAYAGTPVSTRHYDAVGDVELVMGHDGDGGVRGYERWLDLDDAVAGVAYTVAATNVTYVREYFVSSAAADLAAVRIAADRPGAVAFTVHLRRGQGGSLNRWQDYAGKAGHDTVVMGGTSGGGADAIVFGAGARVVARGGTVRTIGDTVLCEGADEAWIYYTAWTTVRRSDPKAAVLADLAAVAADDDDEPAAYYARLRAAHIADYQRLAGRVALSLGTSSEAQRAMNTSDRMAALATRFDPELVALYFQFGRYLLIASSRNGTMAAHLQGIWNDSLDPQWGAKYTIK